MGNTKTLTVITTAKIVDIEICYFLFVRKMEEKRTLQVKV